MQNRAPETRCVYAMTDIHIVRIGMYIAENCYQQCY